MSRPISAAYLERKLRAITGVQGDSPLPDLDALDGLIELECDRPEWMLAGNEQLGWGRETQAAVAAQFSWTALANPATSGVVAVLDAFQNLSAIIVEFFVSYNSAIVGGELGSGTGRPRDTRAGGSTLACLTTFGAQAAAVGDGPGWQIATGTLQLYRPRWDGEWIIGPGTALVAVGNTLNTAVTGLWHWRERPLEGDLEIK